MDNKQPQKKRRGRPAGRNVQRYNITLNPETAEWARDEPEGLSGILRICLNEFRNRREGNARGRAVSPVGDTALLNEVATYPGLL